MAFGSVSAVELFPGVTGPPLIDSLRKYYKSTRILAYAGSPDPRDTLLGEIYLTANDSLECVYSGYTIYMQPGQDPDDEALANDINCEHTWPQSLLNTSQTPNPTGDMHHLFPTRQLVNADRGNSPFAEIPDASTQYWYYKNIERSTSIPSLNIDGYAEVNLNVGTPGCEPREIQKGNTARAMFYMLTMYQLPDTTLAWWTGQKYTLRDWHLTDPSDALEKTRTWLIAAHQQNKPNPFVIDSSLVDRCYFPEYLNTRVFFAATSVTKTEGDAPFSIAASISAPSAVSATSVQVVLTGGSGAAADINNYTTQTLTFPAGSSANQNAAIIITDDALEEGTETLIFKLRNVSGGTSAAIGPDSVFTLTLGDNDDITAPVITSGPTASGITSNSAAISWTTDEISNSWVYYGLTTEYSDTARNESDVTSHSVGLSGLAASTTYHYKVSSVDPMNNGPTYSGDNTFATTAASGGSSFLVENFEYTAGTNLTSNNWTAHSSAGIEPITVSLSGLTYAGYSGSNIGNAAQLDSTGEDDNRTFNDGITSDSVYVSFLVNVASGGAPTGYFLNLGPNPIGSTLNARVYVQDVSGSLKFGLAKWTEAATYTTDSYSYGTTYLLVLKYKFNTLLTTDDLVSLYVFSSGVPASEPATPTLGPLGSGYTDATELGSVALRQYNAAMRITVDGIKIGDAWGSAPLGVELAYFTALGEPGRITLKWTTASEINSYQWQVWRSLDSLNDYQLMISLPTAGTSNEIHNYGWIDKNVLPGVYYYYRLLEKDVNGDTVVYGPVRAAAIPGISGNDPGSWVSCSPNPFKNNITFRYNLSQAGSGKLDIYNISGQLVKSFSENNDQAGQNYFDWNGRGEDGKACSAGVYFFRLNANGINQNGRVILIK